MDTMQNNNNLNAPAVQPAVPTVPPVPSFPSVPPYFAPPKKPKIDITFKKKDIIFMVLFILSAALTVFFGFFGRLALGLTLSVWVLAGITAFYLKDNGDFSVISVSSLIGTLISSLSFTLYGPNGVNAFMAGVLTVGCYAVFAVSLCDEDVFDNMSGVLKLFFTSFISPFVNIAVPVKSAVSKDRNKRKNTIQIIAAVAVSVPILCVIIPLLIESDAAFQGLMIHIAKTIGMTLLKIGITLVISALIMSFAVTNRYDIYNAKLGTGVPSSKPFKPVFTVTVLTILSVVYLTFLFSQLAYFVSSFKGLLPEGFTFADYARRGFFETETVAFINLGIIILLMYLTSRNENDDLPAAVKATMTFICAFSLFFVATAIAKMLMYINTYGLTLLRLFTSVFMLATCAFIIAFLVRVFKINAKTVKYAVAFTLVIFSVLSAVGMERTIASYNVNAYLTGKHQNIDLEYLYSLGDSAIPYIAKVTACNDAETAELAKKSVAYSFKSHINNEYSCYLDSDDYGVNDNLSAIKEYHKDYRFSLTSYQISKVYDDLKLSYYDYVIYSTYPFWAYDYNEDLSDDIPEITLPEYTDTENVDLDSEEYWFG